MPSGLARDISLANQSHNPQPQNETGQMRTLQDKVARAQHQKMIDIPVRPAVLRNIVDELKKTREKLSAIETVLVEEREKIFDVKPGEPVSSCTPRKEGATMRDAITYHKCLKVLNFYKSSDTYPPGSPLNLDLNLKEVGKAIPSYT